MSDKLVFDLAQEIEGSPNVFVRKDWINILDNQNQNYNNNQSILDTSQLSNSNKYMSYREAYLSVPLLLTYGASSFTNNGITTGAASTFTLTPNLALTGDYALGLKNWFGQIIHSFTLDYNGTTIIQQTPYINMWNSFKLMTSLSLNDISTQGATIGFYPDNPLSWEFIPTVTPFGGVGATAGYSLAGSGAVNNINNLASGTTPVQNLLNQFENFNKGLYSRQQLINFDLNCLTGAPAPHTAATDRSATYGQLLAPGFNNLWKSYLVKGNTASITATTGAGAGGIPSAVIANGTAPYIQYQIVATIYLKHIHSFFNMCPLLKGVFMKMTMNLNNTSSTITYTSSYTIAIPSVVTKTSMSCTSVSNAIGGCNPMMVAAAITAGGGDQFTPNATGAAPANVDGTGTFTANWIANISVGSVILNSSLNQLTGNPISNMSKSVYLYIPAYTFNPIFEQSYLSSPIKQIKYTDVYQYQVLNIGSTQQFNNLITNGIANIKSILILPFYSPVTSGSAAHPQTGASMSDNTGFLAGIPVFQSPFDPAGSGPTSPLCPLSNFNVQISGQNAIYNVEKYNFEQFNNQLYGQNAVNGGLTDGITSSLIDRQAFDMEYCYYYVNVERMLPVEQSVPKSVQILGTNYSSKALDLYVFVEYGNEISIDALTGARV